MRLENTSNTKKSLAFRIRIVLNRIILFGYSYYFKRFNPNLYVICSKFTIFSTRLMNMGQQAPHHSLEKLPPLREKVETIYLNKTRIELLKE